MYYRTQRDPSIQSTAVPGVASLTYRPQDTTGADTEPTPHIRQLLAPYRRYSVGNNRG
jgi:hypothetical protein